MDRRGVFFDLLHSLLGLWGLRFNNVIYCGLEISVSKLTVGFGVVFYVDLKPLFRT